MFYYYYYIIVIIFSKLIFITMQCCASMIYAVVVCQSVCHKLVVTAFPFAFLFHILMHEMQQLVRRITLSSTGVKESGRQQAHCAQD